MAQARQTIDERAGEEHGGPHPAALYFALFAPPLAWFCELTTNYALASHACYPSSKPQPHFIPGWEGVWGGLLGFNLACIVISAAGIVTAGYAWRRLLRPHRLPDEHNTIIEPGEGRVRVFAASGLLIGILFTIAVLANTLSLWVLSQCSQI